MNLRKIVTRLIDAGLLRQISKGVYAIGESDLSDEDRVIKHYLNNEKGTAVSDYLLFREGYQKDCPVFKETVSFSKTVNLKAGDRILVKEAHNDSYVTTKSTWSIGISSCDKLSCSYNQKEFATSFTFDENYNLGIPTDIPVGLSFVGWFTGYNGEGTKVTDPNGQSLTKWNFSSNQVFYPYFQ